MIGFYLGGLFVLTFWGFCDFKRGIYPENLRILWEHSPLKLYALLACCWLLWPIYLPISMSVAYMQVRTARLEYETINRLRRCLADEGCDGPVVPGTTLCAFHLHDEFFE